MEYAKTIYDFPNHRISKQGFSEKSKIKIRGGWFGQVIRAMRDYGLIEEADDSLQATELLAKLLFPKTGTNELQEAKEKVFNSVTLWKKLFDDGIKKTDTAKDEFWVYLSDLDGIKGVDREKVKNKAPLVQKSYISALNYVQDVRAPTPSPISKPKTVHPKIESKAIGSDRSERPVPSEGEGKEQLKIQQGGLYIEILQDEKALENIEYAKDLLNVVEKRLKAKMQQNS